MDIVGSVFDVVGETITEGGSAIANVFTSVVGLFYTAGTSGNPGSLTFLGVITVMGIGAGLIFWAIRLLSRGLKRSA